MSSGSGAPADREEARGEHSRDEHSLSLRLEGFTWESLRDESARLSVSVEDLVMFSIQYYLADLDSGRIARRITNSPYPGGGVRGYPGGGAL